MKRHFEVVVNSLRNAGQMEIAYVLTLALGWIANLRVNKKPVTL